ncbi:MAG: autotransporter-associated beta strand repeat-containing protein [Akkermansiaceae bacterium]|jgi:autotransporter-associated beta strand protein|nr:autotransporter-associated beta strand repeat-containing protein [Akkermansiaceae bacterium]
MKSKSANRLFFAVITLNGITLALPTAMAAPLYWDIDGATPGSGGASPSGSWTSGGTTWSTDATGSSATSAYTTLDADDLVFSAAADAVGAYTVSLTDSQAAASLTIEEGAITFEGAGGVLALGGTGGKIVVAGSQSATIGNNTTTAVGGSVGLTKLGSGSLTLNGSAAHPFSGGLRIEGGTLVLDFNHLATPTNLIGPANTLALSKGSVLTLTGQDLAAATTLQSFAATTIGAGTNQVSLSKGASATSATLHLGDLTVNPGATTLFTPNTIWATGVPSTTEIVTVTSINGVAPPASGKRNPSAGLFYRQSASAGSARWVSIDSAGQLQALAATIPVLTATTADPLAAYQISSANLVLTSTTAASHGLVLNPNSNGRTLTLAADGTYTINGILGVQSSNTTSILPGAGTSSIVIGPERNLVINLDNGGGTNGGHLVVSAPITDNGAGASSVTIASTAPIGTTPATTIFSGANTYTGTTHITRGALEIRNASALGTSAAGTTVAAGGRLFAGASFASSTTNEPLTLAGNGTANNGAIHVGGSATGIVFAGPVTLADSTLVRGDGNTGATYSGGIDLGASTLTISADGGASVTINSSGISGSGSVVKSSAGTLNFNTSNSYTGPTTINGGVLSYNNSAAFQGTSGVILNSGTLSTQTHDLTLSTPITLGTAGTTAIAFGRNTSAAGTLNLNSAIGGSGNLTFSSPGSANSGGNLQAINLGTPATYSGNTTITTGNTGVTLTVRAGVADALPTTTVLNLTGGNGSGSGRAVTYDLFGNPQTLAGLTNSIATLTARNQRVTNSGALATLTLNNSADFTFGGLGVSSSFNGNPVNPSAQITGNLALTKEGIGKFTLAAGASNTFNGATTILEGILCAGHPTSLQNSPLDTLASVTGDEFHGLQTTVTTLTLGGLTGDKNLAAIFTTTAGGYDAVTTLTLNPVSGADLSYSGIIADGASGMNLVKSGAGIQTLTAAQSFTGTTTINNGTLRIQGSLPATSEVTINGGQLGGTGTVGGNVIVAAAGGIAPGASAGQLSIGGDLDLVAMAGGTGKLSFELDSLAGSSDRIAVTGTLGLGIEVLGFDDFNFTNLGGLEVGTYTLITSNGIFPGDSLDPANLSGAIGAFNGTLALSGSNLVLNVSPGGYSSWQATNSTAGGIDDDHDGDGVANGIEYFLGGNSVTTGFTALPGVVTDLGGTSITWTKAADYSGVYSTDFIVESSTSLTGTWTAATLGTGAGNVEITGNAVKFTFPTGTRQFARLRVTGP